MHFRNESALSLFNPSLIVLMEVIMRLILPLLAIGLATVLARPVQAGAAGGTPSRFIPPFPDDGCDARCIVRHEAELSCRIITGRRLDQAYTTSSRSINVPAHCNRHHKQGLLASGFKD